VTLQLYSSRIGTGPDVVLLHGLFGMGGNLGALARALQGSFCVHSLDLPNHGRSDWMENMSIDSLAAAVQAWLRREGIVEASLVGHSLGGKVAMRLALDDPQQVARLVVADIAPVAYPAHHDEVFAALAAVAELAPSSRRAAETCMAQFIDEPGVRQFLSLSLKRDADGAYRWRFNLEGLQRNYAAVREELLAEQAFSKPVLFVKGELSDYIQPQHRATIESLFPHAQLKMLPGCGHWLHAEQPRLFNAVVQRFLLAP